MLMWKGMKAKRALPTDLCGLSATPRDSTERRLVRRSFNMIADVFDIPSGTADGVAAACAKEGDQCGRQQQQDETLL